MEIQQIPVVWNPRPYLPPKSSKKKPQYDVTKIPIYPHGGFGIPTVATICYNYPLLNVFTPRPVREDFEAFDYRPASVLIMGHSFVVRLQQFMGIHYGPQHNMGLSCKTATVQFHGVGGRTVKKFEDNDLIVINKCRPDILYLELGTNDLSLPDSDPESVGSQISSLVWKCKANGAKFVIVGQTIPREKPGNVYYAQRYPIDSEKFRYDCVMMNEHLCHALDPENIPDAMYWRHIGFWNNTAQVVRWDDGVHLTEWGNQCYYKSIRGALVHAIRKLDEHLRI